MISPEMRTMMIHSRVSDFRFCRISRKYLTLFCIKLILRSSVWKRASSSNSLRSPSQIGPYCAYFQAVSERSSSPSLVMISVIKMLFCATSRKRWPFLMVKVPVRSISRFRLLNTSRLLSTLLAYMSSATDCPSTDEITRMLLVSIRFSTTLSGCNSLQDLRSGRTSTAKSSIWGLATGLSVKRSQICSRWSRCSTLTLKKTTDPYLKTAMYLSLDVCAICPFLRGSSERMMLSRLSARGQGANSGLCANE
mmetsp:Transcript_38623/g.97739  ORF Transcript_38623/g.97739 Transcript_38623/m.97739 type:complete len:251 (+) Transcript_38623:227-979(+)